MPPRPSSSDSHSRTLVAQLAMPMEFQTLLRRNTSLWQILRPLISWSESVPRNRDMRSHGNPCGHQLAHFP